MFPDRFLSSIFEDPGKKDKLENSNNIHLSSKLPSWMCSLIATMLGTGRDQKKSRAVLATILHVLTLLSGLCFGACGLYFNVYDTLSTFTKTTILISTSKSIIGLYWILLGIYSHSLAARLITNIRVVDCIRLHSKTFMKINMVYIIAILMTSVICLNIYTNVYLLEPQVYNQTKVYDANCASIGVNALLCKVYFASKIVYSVFSLVWNLLVAAICLSICRTLTIGIRRFTRELNFDAHIYEEHQLLRSNPHLCSRATLPDIEEDVETWTIWDDDIKEFEEDLVYQLPSSRENILKDMRTLRRRIRQDSLVEVSVSPRGDNMRDYQTLEEMQRERRRGNGNIQDAQSDYRSSISSCPESIEVEQQLGKDDNNEEEEQEKQNSNGNNGGPPIISNQDLMFTYFKLMRRLSSTSRLLQRWMSCWITFVLLWCALLIIYWISHTATITDLMEFLIPIIAIGLMTSAYAEVNFEGNRILKCLLPTEERLPVIYYFQNAALELKIFSFVMTYNVLVTVCAGVALTIASRIIIDQLN